MAAVCSVDDTTNHGGLNGGGHVNSHGAAFLRCQCAEGSLIFELLAVVKDSHEVVS